MRPCSLAAAALALAAAACGPGSGPRVAPEPPLGEVDDDRDGVVASQDCDDHDTNVFRWIDAYVDADGDGHGSGAPVRVCAGYRLPAGYAATNDDCDDTKPSAWRSATAYVDADQDGVGAGAPQTICTSDVLPPGWASKGGDCDDGDASRWQDLPYLYRDQDRDGYTTALSAGVVCSGADLPPGYTTVSLGLDCDDADANVFAPMSGYVDADHDGVGTGELVSVCAGTYLPLGYAPVTGDCAPEDGTAWQNWSYSYVDRDADGFTRYEPGSVCYGAVLPWWIRWTSNGDDCDDADPSVWKSLTGYADTDEDGVGAGDPVTLCTAGSLPSGYVAQGGDCAPDDKDRWRSFSYAYRDADGDGRTVPETGTLCLGATTPAGYLNAANGLDCNDANKDVWLWLTGYADTDTDGVGAGDPVKFCTAGSLPEGYVATSTDCAPDDSGKWQMLSYAYADRDGDGVTARESGTICAGAVLPDPFRAAASGNDCDDANDALYRWVVLYPDDDRDGVGAPPRQVQCLGATLPDGFSLYGWDPDDGDPLVASAADDEPLFTILF